MSLQKRWLACICGFTGPVTYLQRPPNYCPTCQLKLYRQLRFRVEQASRPTHPADRPAGWEHLSPLQKVRVERYIATLLAEQPRLF